MTATQQQSLIVQETGKPVVEVTRPIPTPKEDEVVIKITSAGSKCLLFFPFDFHG